MHQHLERSQLVTMDFPAMNLDMFNEDTVMTDQQRVVDNLPPISTPPITPRAATITNILKQTEHLRYQTSGDTYQPLYNHQYSSPYTFSPYALPYIQTPPSYTTPKGQTSSIDACQLQSIPSDDHFYSTATIPTFFPISVGEHESRPWNREPYSFRYHQPSRRRTRKCNPSL